jgi:hypothetical protein
MSTMTLPKQGDLFTFSTRVAVDYCPASKRDTAWTRNNPGAPCPRSCWQCRGANTGFGYVQAEEEVAGVHHYADNSIEVVSVTGKIYMAVSPNGDAC